MSKDLTNPFANTAARPAVVTGIQPKLGTIVPQVTTLPTVNPAGSTQFYSVADKANIVFSLAFILGAVANGSLLGLNQTQITAISNIQAQWSATNPYGTALPGNVTIPATSLQDTVIAMQAANFAQTTGALTTIQDLTSSNGQIQLVSGFAPNGASTITIHNQKVIACRPIDPETGAADPFWYASNVGNAASWDALSAGDLETYSDQPVAPDQCYGYLVIFGKQSLEWFQDVGNNPFPYVSIPGAAWQVGLPAIYSRAQFMGNIVFLGRFKTGQMHVMRTNGTGLPVIISTADIDQIINNFSDGQYQDAVASTDDFNGHPVYILTFISAKRTFVFDGITQVWSELQSGTAEYARHLVTLRATLNNGTLGSDYESGNVYVIDPNNYTDNGYIIKREWVSKHVRNDGNLFSIPYVELVMQVGAGSQRLQQTLYANTTVTTNTTVFSNDVIVMSSADEDPGTNSIEGWVDTSLGIGSCGSLVTANANVPAFGVWFNQNSGVNTLKVVLEGDLPQNTFANVSFTDKHSVLENYNTTWANVNYTTAEFPGFTAWEWPAQNNFPFTNGTHYPIKFSNNATVTQNTVIVVNVVGQQDIWPSVHTPHIEMAVSIDGGNIWSEWQPAELGEVGQYRTHVIWRQLGTASDFLLKFRLTDPVPWIVAAAYATIHPSQPN